MTTSKKKIYRNGTLVRELADSEPYVLQDGETLSISVNLMDGMPVFDGAGHRPGYANITDARRGEREQAYFDSTARLSEAWKNVPSLPLASATAPTTPVVTQPHINTGDAESAYERRNVALEQAWRTGGAV